VLAFAGDPINTPAEFLYCDAKLYDKNLFPRLFSAIGYKYGGDGIQFFRVPDGRGGFLRGYSGVPSLVFTANPSTDELTAASAHAFNRSGIPVQLVTTGTLPAPLSTVTTYWVIWVSATVFQLATSRANAISGSFINITTTGTGIHTFNCWLDPDVASREASAPGGATGDSVGSWQPDMFASHTHSGTVASGLNFATGLNANFLQSPAAIGFTGGNETRPWNVTYSFIIKY
jgi:microcystin-dependent protein